MEELLKSTIEALVAIAAVKKVDLQRVIVNTSVQEGAITHPTDSRLLDVIQARIVCLAQSAGIKLKRARKLEAAALSRGAGGYAHPRQVKRLKKVFCRQRTILGIVLLKVQRKIGQPPEAALTCPHSAYQ